MIVKDVYAAVGNSIKKYYFYVWMPAFLFMFILGAAQAFAGEGGEGERQGGYSGPGPAAATVEQAKGMKDDAVLALKGRIVQSLGGDRYMFKDATGSIELEISGKRWQGQDIGPDDLVEIYGEVDKDWSKVKIEVKRIVKL
ncbi:MAG: YgiW/YdeI family stress tolerance OB fold protein [Deltaproteobacteria bacterium]|nr:YgiW/YdeI family stress tolerance OB fold protein [Deltaproteobacteria bacterium]